MSHEPSPSRKLVLEAAQQILCQHGYAGLSMRELARLSGLAKSTIYHHFADKSAIFVAVLERNIAEIRDEIVEAATTPGDFYIRLRAVVKTYFRAQTERGLVVIHALRETHDLDVDLCTILRRYHSDLFQPVEAVIEEAIAAGECRPVNVEMAVVGLYGAVHGLATHRILLYDESQDEDMVNHILDVFLHGLGQPAHVRSKPLGGESPRRATPQDTTAPSHAHTQPMSSSRVPMIRKRRGAD